MLEEVLAKERPFVSDGVLAKERPLVPDGVLEEVSVEGAVASEVEIVMLALGWVSALSSETLVANARALVRVTPVFIVVS